MSTEALFVNTSEKRLSGELKRKSYDSSEGFDENGGVSTANINSSSDGFEVVSSKKLRFKEKESPVPSSTAQQPLAVKVKSNLPRFCNTKKLPANSGNSKRPVERSISPRNKSSTIVNCRDHVIRQNRSATTPRKGNSPKRGNSKSPRSNTAPTTPKGRTPVAVKGATPRGVMTESYLAIASSPVAGTSSSSSVCQGTPNTNAMLKRLKNFLSNGTNTIKRHFENAIAADLSTKVEKILAGTAGSKLKYEYKEKIAKQISAMKELKGIIGNMLTEFQTVKENCVLHDLQMNQLLSDVYEELQDYTRNCTSLRQNEVKIMRDLGKSQDDLETAKNSILEIKSITSPLRSKAEDMERKFEDAYTKLQALEPRHVSLEAEYETLNTDYQHLKESSEKSLHESNVLLEQRVEKAVQEHRENVAALRLELNKRENDSTSIAEQRADLEKKNAALQQEMVLLASKVREAENSLIHAGKENTRLTSELTSSSEDMKEKDADLRSTLKSLTEMQVQSMEEKCSLRAENDLMKSRVQLLEDERLSITAQLAGKKEENSSYIRDNVEFRDKVGQLEGRLLARDIEVGQMKESVMQLEVEKELRARSEHREEAERQERIAANAQLMAIQTECSIKLAEVDSRHQATIEGLRTESQLAAAAKASLEEEGRTLSNLNCGMVKEIEQLKHALENASPDAESIEAFGRATGEIEVLKRRLQEVTESQENMILLDKAKVQDYEEKIRSSEIARRKLHNLVQELRGNVRVFARVRPFLPSDGVDIAANPEPVINVTAESNSMRIARAADPTKDSRAEAHSFIFDKAFGPSTSQEKLFEEVSEFVQSALDGYNVCLFSYGQTGSGKTHTMQGSGSGNMRGVIPRAMQQVGMYKRELEAKGWEYQMEVSFIEIYNEDIKDLLRSGSHEVGKHEIKKDPQGNASITDITMTSVDPNDTEQIDSIMELAARHRSVGQTAMNERSSRSHSIFALHLKAVNKVQGIVLKGTLNLVDLAGSERLEKSGATGAMLKETVAINKSLSSLTDVFVAIGNKQSHIPFRNSKLTYLLQPALSGDGKTLMMVNLSPTEDSFQESLCSLRLARQINQCELGKPKKQLASQSNGSEPSFSSETHASSSVGPGALARSTSGTSTSKTLSSSLGAKKNSASSLLKARTPSKTARREK